MTRRNKSLMRIRAGLLTRFVAGGEGGRGGRGQRGGGLGGGGGGLDIDKVIIINRNNIELKAYLVDTVCLRGRHYLIPVLSEP